MSRYQVVHVVLAALMLLILVLPVPWASYGSGHYLIGLRFVSLSWTLIPALVVLPSHLHPGHFLLLNWLLFSGGLVLLIFANLFSTAITRPWLDWLRRAAVGITLLSALPVALTWPRPTDSGLFVGFWLAVGLVGIAGLIEIAAYRSRGRKISSLNT